MNRSLLLSTRRRRLRRESIHFHSAAHAKPCQTTGGADGRGRRYECPASVRQEVQQQPQRTFRRPPAALIADDGAIEKCEVQTESEIIGKARLPLLNLTSQSFPLVNLLSPVVFAHSVILSPTVKVVLN